ncbi:MAG: WYL domain-containing protein, partial [Thiopseudomonas sp.]
ALLEDKQIKAAYRGKPDRIIHPYGLIQQGGILYLICRFYEFDDIRITALQRYNKVEVLEENTRPFPDFKIDEYLNQGAMKWLPEKQQKMDMGRILNPSATQLMN